MLLPLSGWAQYKYILEIVTRLTDFLTSSASKLLRHEVFVFDDVSHILGNGENTYQVVGQSYDFGGEARVGHHVATTRDYVTVQILNAHGRVGFNKDLTLKHWLD